MKSRNDMSFLVASRGSGMLAERVEGSGGAGSSRVMSISGSRSASIVGSGWRVLVGGSRFGAGETISEGGQWVGESERDTGYMPSIWKRFYYVNTVLIYPSQLFTVLFAEQSNKIHNRNPYTQPTNHIASPYRPKSPAHIPRPPSPPTMPLTLKECTDSTTFSAIIDCQWAAYYNPYHTFMQVLFPVFGATSADRAAS